MKKCFILILTLFCIVPLLTAAPTPRIKGILVEAGSKKPIDFADILLFVNGNESPVSHTLPETDGSFSISGINDGEYTLLIKLVGFDIYSRSNLVLNSSTPLLNLGTIEMKALEVGLAEVEIVAQKKQIIYKLDKKVIEASSNLLANGGSAVDILENTPSIRVDAEGNVSFRGSSGFAVYVDGKPSVFSGTQALEQIPSGHIENIELITTPSARHDTEGDVGIINIITKKHSQQGLSGMVNISGSTVYSRALDFLLTQQNLKSRWYVGGAYTERVRKSDFNQEKKTIVADTATTSHSDGPRRSRGFNYSLKAGWLYTLTQTTFNLDVEGGYGGTTRNGNLDYTEERKANGSVFEQGDYLSHDRYEIDETYLHGTVGFAHKFDNKGHNLTGSFYAKYGGDALEYFSSDLIDDKGQRQQGHRAYEDEHRWTIRANLDYLYPYRETGRLEAGYQYFSYLEDGDYSMEFWNPGKREFYWRNDIYNTFYFQRGINSFYGILADSYRSFDFQVGVRAEHTHRVLRSSKEWANRTVNRFEFFPSAHIGYNFPKEHTVTASFSRRTTRPQLFYMEPYITYRDYYSAEIGNPDIRPEYINSYELNYKKNIDIHAISATFFHRNRKDKIERLRVPYEAGVTLDSMANVGHDYSTGLELSVQVQPIRWWNVNINGSLYHYKVKNEYKLGNSNETSTNYEIAFNNGFDAGKYTRIQLDGNFVGPSVTTQGRTDAFWYANLAIRQQLFKRKLNATLSFRDMFNSARYNSRINTSVLQSYTKIRPKYPLIMLTLSYTFNNFKASSSQGRETHDLFEGTNH
ncbi:outer membrane receptor protein involved in Fe transport [Parabacteroides sp. PF5-5]|uniref:outer membrane beta-barrel family protein n=1 Tax=unclassified Parabacteroides TaxID=2649774 RepID=UPI002473B0E7|nr:MULTISPECIES: outer membrane beta-barrel family protein [unclassified Parabacteroides]MDH6306920.1 outer membrane receptor protein involved in Fe transport [Parabacteroides sp. PH5-39]MDH6317820.1 outer membrane receptor protein involved in Fe transport [Parabacteroides sp. PF5-13]MDH6321525.1 outer membrane receptor protein involved in Fe transport [Parabacteroides sp. PH5-13]MDH6325307.1 outer membrane receptor protein involved in Fe transport [Parabacteroides sp. PH5-8]MDH6328978.1 outer